MIITNINQLKECNCKLYAITHYSINKYTTLNPYVVYSVFYNKKTKSYMLSSNIKKTNYKKRLHITENQGNMMGLMLFTAKSDIYKYIYETYTKDTTKINDKLLEFITTTYPEVLI